MFLQGSSAELKLVQSSFILIPRSLLGLSRNQNKQEGAGRTNTLMLLKRGQKTNKTHSHRMWTIINPHTITQTVSNSSKASLNSAFWSSIIEAMMMDLVLIGNYWISFKQLLVEPRPPFLRDRTLDRRCRQEWSGFRPSSCHSSVGDCVFSTNEKGAQVHLRHRVFLQKRSLSWTQPQHMLLQIQWHFDSLSNISWRQERITYKLKFIIWTITSGPGLDHALVLSSTQSVFETWLVWLWSVKIQVLYNHLLCWIWCWCWF